MDLIIENGIGYTLLAGERNALNNVNLNAGSSNISSILLENSQRAAANFRPMCALVFTFFFKMRRLIVKKLMLMNERTYFTNYRGASRVRDQK